MCPNNLVEKVHCTKIKVRQTFLHQFTFSFFFSIFFSLESLNLPEYLYYLAVTLFKKISGGGGSITLRGYTKFKDIRDFRLNFKDFRRGFRDFKSFMNLKSSKNFRLDFKEFRSCFRDFSDLWISGQIFRI